MNVTIDRAGRIVVPAEIRRRMGLEAGATLSVTLEDERLVLEPASPPMTFDAATGRIEVADDTAMPVLSVEDVRATLERIRR